MGAALSNLIAQMKGHKGDNGGIVKIHVHLWRLKSSAIEPLGQFQSGKDASRGFEFIQTYSK